MVLGLFLITPSWADDITDFQIEGISLGDNALDFIIDEDKIDKKFWPGSKKYYSFDLGQNSKIKFETYDNMQFIVKNGDKKYKLQGIKGYIYYRNDIIGCFEKKRSSR